jgi:hypothetical protein
VLLCPPFNQTPQNCGSAGLCQTCMPGSQCVNFTCVPNGPDAGLPCTVVPPMSQGTVAGVFLDPTDGGPLAEQGVFWVVAHNPDMTIDVLEVLVVPGPMPASLPWPISFSGMDRLSTCSTCVVYGASCGAAGCAREYFAQTGGGETLAIGTELDAGHMAGFASMLHLVEWDFRPGPLPGLPPVADSPVAGGGCVNLVGYDYHLTYQYLGGQQWAFDAG